MKAEAPKNRKQRQTATLKTKSTCGTLTHLAECRGAQQKSAPSRKETSSIIGRIAYKQPPLYS